LKIISKTPIRCKITQQYLNFEILKLDDLYTFEIGKIIYQFLIINTTANITEKRLLRTFWPYTYAYCRRTMVR